MRSSALVFMAALVLAGCGDGPVEPRSGPDPASPPSLDPLARDLLGSLPAGQAAGILQTIRSAGRADPATARTLRGRALGDLRRLAADPDAPGDAAVAADALALLLDRPTEDGP